MILAGGRLDCAMAFNSVFRRLASGMTPCEVEARAGRPDEREDTVIPAGSAWGVQDTLAFKIHAGEPVKQWVYRREGKDHCVWFAFVDGTWKLTLRLSLPAGIVTGHRAS